MIKSIIDNKKPKDECGVFGIYNNNDARNDNTKFRLTFNPFLNTINVTTTN